MEDLQNLAGKIEELKEKLSDGEYKELLELAKECYDKKEEEKRKFVKVMCIQSQMSLDMTAKVSAGDCNCENCQEEGHMASECTNDKVEKEAPPMTCRTCNAEGHKSADCPDKPVFKCFNCVSTPTRAPPRLHRAHGIPCFLRA